LKTRTDAESAVENGAESVQRTPDAKQV